MPGSLEILFILLSGACAIAAASTFIEWRRGHESAMIWWCAGFLLAGLSVAFLPLRLVGLNGLSIGVGNAALLLGYGALFAGVAHFVGRKDLTGIAWLGGALWLVFWQFCPAAASFDDRVVVVSAGMAFYSLIAGWLVFKYRPMGAISLALVLLFGLRTLFHVGRLVWTIQNPSGAAAELLTGVDLTLVMMEGIWSAMLLSYLLIAWNREKRESSLERLADTDFLTGIANRRAFSSRARAMIAGSSPNEEVALLVLDIDHFKQVNDTHGHAFGDEILQCLASAVSERVSRKDVFARLGGEEFAILLKGRTAASAAAEAETIRTSFAAAVSRRHAGLELSVSIGLATTRQAGSLELLMELADGALYEAKRSGRDRVVIAKPLRLAAGAPPPSPLARNGPATA
ncbi:GGDEF domain-containing protein [Jiella marina]|uniref:GGDEF domain-containing protein n=1 Tax=Jiella sp. LLJ827 TaxID=2917712 RepID=UPI0021011752|nr:GGDEF domain-containing protein [Jiella sp. LLJ827]MCQ0989251.1 GGDEF domain-containing protein [Jiella sp. LLJ827]